MSMRRKMMEEMNYMQIVLGFVGGLGFFME